MKVLQKSSYQHHLYIAGQGPLEASIRDRISALGLDSNITLLGVRSDIPRLLAGADVFVLSSAWEGFPLVIGEAMASEKVVVSTDCGGVSEFLGDTGFVVPTRNSSALAEALLSAMSMDGSEKLALGSSARKRVVAYFSHAVAVSKWVDIYSTQVRR